MTGPKSEPAHIYALYGTVRQRATNPAHTDVVRAAVWQLAPQPPKRFRTAAQLSRFKCAQREFDRVLLDLRIAAPAEVQARNSIAPNSRPVLLNVASAHRRTKQKRFRANESDHLICLARLWSRAIDVFEAEQGALDWLKQPALGLGGRILIETAKTESGAHDVETFPATNQLRGAVKHPVRSRSLSMPPNGAF